MTTARSVGRARLEHEKGDGSVMAALESCEPENL